MTQLLKWFFTRDETTHTPSYNKVHIVGPSWSTCNEDHNHALTYTCACARACVCYNPYLHIYISDSERKAPSAKIEKNT